MSGTPGTFRRPPIQKPRTPMQQKPKTIPQKQKPFNKPKEK